MQITLHIGTEKSGTTTIQRFLDINRDLLHAQGVWVPLSLGRVHHRRLSAIFLNHGVVDDFFRHEGLQDRDARIAAKRSWQDEFEAEIQARGAEHVVVCSEHLQSRLTAPEGIRALFDYLSQRFSRIRIILYIREPLATAVSLYSTAIKSGGVLADVPEPGHPYWNNIVNHQETIRRWQANMPSAELELRLFQKDDFVQGDLLSDFIAAAGLPQLEYKRPPRANESLNRVGIELLRRFNGEVPVFLPDGRVNPMRGGILPFFEEHFRAGKSFLPRAQTIAAYEAAFAESNEWVRKTFFPQRARLFKPVAGAATGDTGLSPQELDQMAGLTAELWRQWRRKMLETPKKPPVP